MTVTQQIDELILNRINAKTTSTLTSLIHSGFSSLLEKSTEDETKEKETVEDLLSKEDMIKQNLQSQAYLNKIILNSAA